MEIPPKLITLSMQNFVGHAKRASLSVQKLQNYLSKLFWNLWAVDGIKNSAIPNLPTFLLILLYHMVTLITIMPLDSVLLWLMKYHLRLFEGSAAIEQLY